MRRNLAAYEVAQVFLNYPYSPEFMPLADAMHFAVVAAGMLPLCAQDLSMPDKPRLETLVEAIVNCHYSAHDLSRGEGEGDENFARQNMPLEMGMALFHALQTQRHEHRCAFLVSQRHDYQIFVSDLSGLDPKYYTDDSSLVASMYEWLRDAADPIANRQPVPLVKEKYLYFRARLDDFEGSGTDGRLSHDEAQEVMYEVCEECGWWDWRATKLGKLEFPKLPLKPKH